MPSSESLVLDGGGQCTECQEGGYFSTEGSIKVMIILVSSKDETFEGKLQVNYNGVWGAVCDDLWNIENTRVVCRELGLGSAVTFYTNYDYNREYFTKNEIVLDDVQCTGDEESLLHCKYLGPSKQNCARTETMGIKCSGPDIRRSCVRQCRVGQYGDRFAHKCFPCDTMCLDCIDRPNKCILCEHGKFRMKDDKCVSLCGAGYYGNTNRQFCEPCSASCHTCADSRRPDNCLSCHGNKKLYNNHCLEECPQGTFLLERISYSCVKECPVGYVSEAGICVKCSPKCRTCTNIPENCTICQGGFDLQIHQDASESIGSCQRSCNMGFYSNAFNVCNPCLDSNCHYCYRGGHFCQQCNTGFLIEFHTCIHKCSPGLFPNEGVCSADCPDGFYGNLMSDHCETCPANCRRCRSATRCETCYEGFYLKEDNCVQDCGSNMISISDPPSSDVRLVGGRNSLEGRVEMIYNGLWGHICGATWSMQAANVVCSQLRLGHALRVSIK